MTDTPPLADEEDLVAVATERETLVPALPGRHASVSRQIAADFALDQAVPHDQLGQVSLRWIYVHIIREHARHIGHADIIREQIDGATGD